MEEDHFISVPHFEADPAKTAKLEQEWKRLMDISEKHLYNTTALKAVFGIQYDMYIIHSLHEWFDLRNFADSTFIMMKKLVAEGVLGFCNVKPYPNQFCWHTWMEKIISYCDIFIKQSHDKMFTIASLIKKFFESIIGDANVNLKNSAKTTVDNTPAKVQVKTSRPKRACQKSAIIEISSFDDCFQGELSEDDTKYSFMAKKTFKYTDPNDEKSMEEEYADLVAKYSKPGVLVSLRERESLDERCQYVNF